MVPNLCDDSRRVLRIADRCGVPYTFLDPRADDPLKFVAGPRGHFIDTQNRKVLFQTPFPSKVPTVRDEELLQPEVMFHEVAHVYTQPPYWGIDETAEDLVLMQWERSVARCYFSKAGYNRVIEWQHITVAHNADEALEAIQERLGYDYRRCEWWRAGFLLLRKLGGLTRSNRPTFKPLNWGIVKPRDATNILRAIREGADKRGRSLLNIVRALPGEAS